jgi:hypothetical protein
MNKAYPIALLILWTLFTIFQHYCYIQQQHAIEELETELETYIQLNKRINNRLSEWELKSATGECRCSEELITD